MGWSKTDHYKEDAVLAEKTVLDGLLAKSSRKWMEGPKITLEQLKYALPPFERITHEEAMCGGEFVKERGPPIEKKNPAVLMFGKYKGKTYQWVRKNDMNYFEWACREVKGFTTKAKKFT